METSSKLNYTYLVPYEKVTGFDESEPSGYFYSVLQCYIIQVLSTKCTAINNKYYYGPN